MLLIIFCMDTLKNERVIFNWEKQSKIINHFMQLIKKKFFLRIYKMYLISAKGYKSVNVEFLAIKATIEIWVNMKDIGSGMVVKNIFDLVLKEIYGIFETKNPIKKQVNEYKMTKREICKKVTNLSDEELNTKINKKAYVKVVS